MGGAWRRTLLRVVAPVEISVLDLARTGSRERQNASVWTSGPLGL
jgi:hypothetical protein